MKNLISFLRLPLGDLDDVHDAVGSRWERLRGQTILLTGGTGFVGKWLLGTFLYANQKRRLDARIRVLSRHRDSFIKDYVELQDATEIEWLTGDVRDLSANAGRDCAYAIHAATDVVSPGTPEDVFSTCELGTRRVLESISAGPGVSRVLVLSSGAVYGRLTPEMTPVAEDWNSAPDPLATSSAYGEGKRVSELHCAMKMAAQPNLEISIARGFAFVGPHLPLDKHFAIGNFITAAMRGENIRIHGDGTPLRSYLYAADLAHWLWVLLFDGSKGRAYNVGGAQGLSMIDLAHRVNLVLAGKGRVEVALPAHNEIAPQAYVPSICRIAKELGLKPTVDLDDAILRTAKWAGFRSKN